jgi:hypothetical protein
MGLNKGYAMECPFRRGFGLIFSVLSGLAAVVLFAAISQFLSPLWVAEAMAQVQSL